MLIYENILLALAGLRANKLRSFLTMLGIVIGIASVIAIMTVGDATSKSVMSSMSDMGANNINVYLMAKGTDADGTMSDGSNTRAVKSKDYFTESMFDDLGAAFPQEIEGVSLSKNIGEAKAEEKTNYANVNVSGVNELNLKGRNLKLLAGRLLAPEDYAGVRKVALVSDKFVNNMFHGDAASAVGSPMEIKKGNKYYSYTIVGVYEYVASSEQFAGGSMGAEKDLRTDCYIPLETVLTQEKQEMRFDNFEVVAKTGADPAGIADSIANYLNERYYKDNDTYEAFAYSMKAMLGELEGMLNTQKLAFAAIGAISLLVGGIGVMNIMIVSITERTREIGTRKALGATNGSIRLQFIMEAIVICLIGGIIGVVLGLILGLFASKMMNYPGTPSVSGIIFCVLFSIAFGVFFGYYPANKAAKLNPIEALRYE